MLEKAIFNLVLLVFAVFLSAQPAGGAMSGNTVIENLNTLSQTYVDLTNLVITHQTTTLVATYQNATSLEIANEDATQPTTPFSAEQQYGIAAASHSLAIEDRRFLLALVNHYSDFTAKEKSTLGTLLKQQLKVVHTFDKDDKLFGPEVLGIIKADDAILDTSLQSAVAKFSS